MTRRNYGQACSIAGALDRIGERWSMLIVRELLLGPLRFSDLTRGVGGAPTDVLTRRLRDLEADGIVRRRELDPPASVVVYELTELGGELDRPLLELGRWGLNFFRIEDVPGIESSWLPNSLRVILRPPPDAAFTAQLHSDGDSFHLKAKAGEIAAERGEAADPDLTLSGVPRDVLAALIVGEAAEEGVDIEGDREVLAELRSMVVLPERLRDEALAAVGAARTRAQASSVSS
jgi:DNA-binding HxlR family transcriptional regulator